MASVQPQQGEQSHSEKRAIPWLRRNSTDAYAPPMRCHAPSHAPPMHRHEAPHAPPCRPPCEPMKLHALPCASMPPPKRAPCSPSCEPMKLHALSCASMGLHGPLRYALCDSMRPHAPPRTLNCAVSYEVLHMAHKAAAMHPHAPPCGPMHSHPCRVVRGAAHGPQGRSHAPPCDPHAPPCDPHALSPVPCRTRCCIWPTRPQPCDPHALPRDPMHPHAPPYTLTRAVSYEVLHSAPRASAMRHSGCVKGSFAMGQQWLKTM